MKPILFILSGLPATGKSTLSKYIAKEYNAIYLRVDTIEQGLRDICSFDVKGEGYRLSYRIANDNLQLGINVVADCCNPIELTRKEWEEMANENKSVFINIEIICSDENEHKKRIETRVSEISNLKLPTWEDIRNRDYHAWTYDRIIIDTANKPLDMCRIELNNKIQFYLKDLELLTP